MTEGRPIPSKQESEKSMLVGDKWFQIRLPCPCLEFLLNNISPIVLHFEWWKLFFSVICVCIRPSSSAASQLAKVLNSVYPPSHTAPHPLLCMNLGSFVSIWSGRDYFQSYPRGFCPAKNCRKQWKHTFSDSKFCFISFSIDIQSNSVFTSS